MNPAGTSHSDLLAEFCSAGDLLAAARAMREQGYREMEAYSPFPVDDLAETLGHGESTLPRWMLGGGLISGLAAYFMQYYSAVHDYPILSGGKPLHSWPAFLPVTFEMFVLGAVFTGLVGLLYKCGLPRLHHPLFANDKFSCASRDCFFLLVSKTDPRFHGQHTREALLANQAVNVSEVSP